MFISDPMMCKTGRVSSSVAYQSIGVGKLQYFWSFGINKDKILWKVQFWFDTCGTFEEISSVC